MRSNYEHNKNDAMQSLCCECLDSHNSFWITVDCSKQNSHFCTFLVKVKVKDQGNSTFKNWEVFWTSHTLCKSIIMTQFQLTTSDFATCKRSQGNSFYLWQLNAFNQMSKHTFVRFGPPVGINEHDLDVAICAVLVCQCLRHHVRAFPRTLIIHVCEQWFKSAR